MWVCPSLCVLSSSPTYLSYKTAPGPYISLLITACAQSWTWDPHLKWGRIINLCWERQSIEAWRQALHRLGNRTKTEMSGNISISRWILNLNWIVCVCVRGGNTLYPPELSANYTLHSVWSLTNETRWAIHAKQCYASITSATPLSSAEQSHTTVIDSMACWWKPLHFQYCECCKLGVGSDVKHFLEGSTQLVMSFASPWFASSMVVPPERVGGANTGDPVWIAGNAGPNTPLKLPLITIVVECSPK